MVAARRPLVLGVDDDKMVRDTVTSMLAGSYAVETAEDGAKALERISAQTPELVLVDLLMPVMDGWTLIARLSQMPQAPRIIVMTAHAHLGRDVFAPNVRGWLVKPFRAGELLESCRQALGEAG